MAVHLIMIEGDAAAYTCREDQSVLAALAPVYNRRILSGCHGGGCGVCKVRIHEGEYTCHAMSIAHVCAAEREQRFALACQTFPRSDLRIEPCGKLMPHFEDRAAHRGANNAPRPSDQKQGEM